MGNPLKRLDFGAGLFLYGRAVGEDTELVASRGGHVVTTRIIVPRKDLEAMAAADSLGAAWLEVHRGARERGGETMDDSHIRILVDGESIGRRDLPAFRAFVEELLIK